MREGAGGVSRRFRVHTVLVLLVGATVALGSTAAYAVTPPPPPTYRANDYGNILNILPAGANGLATGPQVIAFKGMGTRPAHSDDQFAPYRDLIYAAPGLKNALLNNYFKDASFGIKPGDLAITESPDASASGVSGAVNIYRDASKGVPHIYGTTTDAMAFGAGYASAEDRLFLMDVLRHYGAGHLSEFLGPSCSDEQMDHDQLHLTGYIGSTSTMVPAGAVDQKQQQLDFIMNNLGPLGVEGRSLIHSYVLGINKYIADATMDPTNKMPAEYPTATGGTPGNWTDTDIIDIAGLVGGIFGKGGGAEVQNSRLLQFLKKTFGNAQGAQMFTDLHQQNDVNAPTTIKDKSFPYEIPGTINPATTALTDPTATVTDPTTAQTMNCNLNTNLVNLPALPTVMSNALLVDAKHSTTGRPIAVFGPQVGYFQPQILSEVDLHAPDYDSRGASFAGTNFIVELGRGQDYAWSATSAGTDNVDLRLLEMCPDSGTAQDNKWYMFDSHDGRGRVCTKLLFHDEPETAVIKPGGTGFPAMIDHYLYQTAEKTNGIPTPRMIVQAFTKDTKGHDVAIAAERSTYLHELDSAAGFLAWQHPSMTHDAASWMVGAQNIGYTFNWFYIDNKDIAYYVSGKDPIRPSNVDPYLPTWGDGQHGWTGYLGVDAHPHEVNPPSGVFVSWNNKPAPGFSAADEQYAYGDVYRSQSLEDQIQHQFSIHNNKLTRANLVEAMSTASTVDLTGTRVLPELLPYIQSNSIGTSAGVQSMISQLNTWLAGGAHRIKADHAATDYLNPAAIAVMDELFPRVVRAVFDNVLSAADIDNSNAGLSNRYNRLPQGFVDYPSLSRGSSYDGGYEGYIVKLLRQLQGESVGSPFGSALMANFCGAGGAVTDCKTAIDKALTDTYNALVTINGTAVVANWKNTTANPKTTMPEFDSIKFATIGLVDQPHMDWQNRPTFQQVVDFTSHRPRGATPSPAPSAGVTPSPVAANAGDTTKLPPTTTDQVPGLGLLMLVLGSLVLAFRLRRRTRA